MRAIWITKPGGPQALELRETADPVPGPGQVRVRVQAAGLCFADVMAAQGLYPDAPKRPCVVGYEAAGIIDALGPGVNGPSADGSGADGHSADGHSADGHSADGHSADGHSADGHSADGHSLDGPSAGGGDADGLAVGCRVLALTRFGGHSDVVCVPVAQVFQIPDEMSFEQAAAIPVNYLTAYHMLFRVANVRPGERVLLHMAAGGVGIAVLQLCRTVAGLQIFGTASASKHAVIKDEGCTYPIDYHTVDYAAEVRRLTGGEGVDVVLDPLGGKDWRKGLRLLRPGGRLVAFGFANLASGQHRNPARIMSQLAGVPRLTPLQLMDHNRSVSGVNIGHLWGEVAVLREELKSVLALWEAGAIVPRIDAVFPFTEAAAAQLRILSRENVGKIVLTP